MNTTARSQQMDTKKELIHFCNSLLMAYTYQSLPLTLKQTPRKSNALMNAKRAVQSGIVPPKWVIQEKGRKDVTQSVIQPITALITIPIHTAINDPISIPGTIPLNESKQIDVNMEQSSSNRPQMDKNGKFEAPDSLLSPKVALFSNVISVSHATLNQIKEQLVNEQPQPSQMHEIRQEKMNREVDLAPGIVRDQPRVLAPKRPNKSQIKASSLLMKSVKHRSIAAVDASLLQAYVDEQAVSHDTPVPPEEYCPQEMEQSLDEGHQMGRLPNAIANRVSPVEPKPRIPPQETNRTRRKSIFQQKQKEDNPLELQKCTKQDLAMYFESKRNPYLEKMAVELLHYRLQNGL